MPDLEYPAFVRFVLHHVALFREWQVEGLDGNDGARADSDHVDQPRNAARFRDRLRPCRAQAHNQQRYAEKSLSHLALRSCGLALRVIEYGIQELACIMAARLRDVKVQVQLLPF